MVRGRDLVDIDILHISPIDDEKDYERMFNPRKDESEYDSKQSKAIIQIHAGQ